MLLICVNLRSDIWKWCSIIIHVFQCGDSDEEDEPARRKKAKPAAVCTFFEIMFMKKVCSEYLLDNKGYLLVWCILNMVPQHSYCGHVIHVQLIMSVICFYFWCLISNLICWFNTESPLSPMYLSMLRLKTLTALLRGSRINYEILLIMLNLN